MKNKRLWMTASFICIILGVILTATGRLMGGKPGFFIDPSGVHALSDVNNSDPIQASITLDEFVSMEIYVDYADVELMYSDEFAIEYCVMGNYGEPVCEVKNGRLTFRNYHNRIGFFTATINVAVSEPHYYVRVKIPKGIKLSEAIFDIESGNLDISSIQADTLKVDDGYGDVTVGQYEGKKLDIVMESGRLSLGTINASQTVLSNEYGKIGLSKATGERLTVQMESCDCKIDRLDFSETDITNSYGNISLRLSGEIENYGYNLKTEYGTIRIANQKEGYESDGGEALYLAAGNGVKMVTISCESGDIEIEAAE